MVALTTTIAALKVFAPVFILTGGGPTKSTYVPSFYAYNEFINGTDKGYAATIASASDAVLGASRADSPNTTYAAPASSPASTSP